MKNTYFTVGPSQLFPTVKQHLCEAIEQQIGSISHRSAQFEEIFSSAVSRLKVLLSIPETHTVFFVSSGTEAMERTIQNVVEKESLHFVNGAFSKRFFEIAIELGKQASKIEVDLGQGLDFHSRGEKQDFRGPRLAPNLAEGISIAEQENFRFDLSDLPRSIELICFTHNETSTGVMISAAEIADIKKRYPDKLVAIDTVSSAPYGEIDYNNADIVFFSIQKLFGLPSGLGVMIVSPQALEKASYLQKKGVVIGSYHNFLSLKTWADKHQTAETPSVLHLYLLNAILGDMLVTGIEHIRKQTDEKAALLYDFFDHHNTWSTFVKDKAVRSPTVIVAHLGDDQKKVKAYLKQHNMLVGPGYGLHKDSQIRIANFPALTKKDIKLLIKRLEEFTK